ncbi:MAG TPA: hypothetical protein VHT26_07670 [Trebonia sp.]|nr:hypothetical protein [Trebonia sp.]
MIALTTLIGGFTLLIISQITGQQIAPGTLTLITTLMASVTGWYFGTRSALAGAQAATTVQAATSAQAATAAAITEHEQAH